jgi:shikimate kinase
MKPNITLIGMPGAGKSTTGIILAKLMSFGLIDTDVLIQTNQKKSLQKILDESDHMNLRRMEEEEILKIRVKEHVIATGGSAVYSQEAMEHLGDISVIVFLKADYDILQKRIRNFYSRGIAKAPNQSFMELYGERQPLYEKYARLTIECNDIFQEEAAELIVNRFSALYFLP